jgi:WD40 repeat protein
MYDADGAGSALGALGGQALMSSVSLSGDGRWVAAKTDYEMHLFDRAAGKPVPLPELPAVHAIALSGDGSTAVAGIGDIEGGAVVVLKLPAATESVRIPVAAPALFVATSADGRWVAASGLAQSPVVRVIDTVAKREVWQHAGTAETVLAFSPDGTRLAMVSADGTLRTFETATGAPGLRVPVRGVRALAFDSEGRVLMAGVIQPTLAAGTSATVLRYLLSPGDLIADACARVTRNLTEAEWGRYVGADVPYSRTCAARP